MNKLGMEEHVAEASARNALGARRSLWPPHGLKRAFSVHDGLGAVSELRGGHARVPNTRALELSLAMNQCSIDEYNEVYNETTSGPPPAKLPLPEAPFSDSDDEEIVAESKHTMQQDARAARAAAPLMRRRLKEHTPPHQLSAASTRSSSPLFLRSREYAAGMWW
jgi:hypothetical protein